MTDPATVRAVVRYLGLAALMLIAFDFLLLRQVIRQGSGTGTIDAATLGAIGSMSTLTGTVLGALGAVLVSTRTSSEDPQEVRVSNEPDDRIPVDPEAG